jgi:transcription elongation GreA/GreB family factor
MVAMSRAFVKETDADAVEDLPDRPVSGHPNDVTAEGLAQIETAVAAAQAAHAAAQTAGDRAAMAQTSRDLRYWSARRATAHVVPETDDTTQVRFGVTVTIVRDDGREQIFRIVGEDEADPSRGTLSHASPLARALFGKKVGDVVPAGNGEAEIVGIGRGGETSPVIPGCVRSMQTRNPETERDVWIPGSREERAPE